MSDTQRTSILSAMDTRLWAGFNLAEGTQAKVFRAHRIGPLQPWATKPSYTLSDNGQRRADDHDNASGGRILAVRLTLHLAKNWDREDEVGEAANLVEQVVDWLHGRPGYGIEDIRYIADDPVDFVPLRGEREAVWVIDFEVHYFTDVDEFDDWV